MKPHARAQVDIIAAFCGYRKHKFLRRWAYAGSRVFSISKLPDYLHDLTVMTAAVELLDKKQREVYCERLLHITAGTPEDPFPRLGFPELVKFEQATAAQKAQAFVDVVLQRTITDLHA